MLTKTSLVIRLHADDDVVIARQQLVSGTVLIDENVTVSGLIPPGHKIATRAIADTFKSRGLAISRMSTVSLRSPTAAAAAWTSTARACRCCGARSAVMRGMPTSPAC